MDIGNKLKELRLGNKNTQEQIADLLGMTRTAYARYEKNERAIAHASLLKLADYYDVSMDEIYGRE